VARFIAKASEKKYRYVGKSERIPSTGFGPLSNWDSSMTLKESLDKHAQDASTVASGEVTSDEDLGPSRSKSSSVESLSKKGLKSIVQRIDGKIERAKLRKQILLSAADA
jgi:hypothetical protein